ncbi:NAD(P)-dependent oxidoreductase [Janibacter sp. YIM B02568]|nr:NAD(P)-dependent oxidoreductase [Janibacter endophyticus]
MANALREAGHEVARQRTPRLRVPSALAARAFPATNHECVDVIASALEGCNSVINAAGDPDASSQDLNALLGANAAIPGLVAAAAQQVGVRRVIHVSSAAVQGRRPVLDESPEVQPFSPYSWSKAVGERTFQSWAPEEGVIYRPGSVHAPDRRVTRSLSRLARSPLSTVAGDGSNRTPQALIGNVGSAIAFLATTESKPPPIVIHPWEGMTTQSLLEALGHQTPRHLPAWAARALLTAGRLASRLNGRVEADVRRVEICWMGQGQADSWLTVAGWLPPMGAGAWESLAEQTS